MHNLNDVMAKAPSNIVDAVGATTNEVLSGQIFWGLTSNEWGHQTGAIATRTLSADTNTVQAGYYVATNLSEVDPDLASTNIRVDATIFGVTGTVYECSVPKTGQINDADIPGDDCDLQAGMAWPVPRFTINTNAGGSANGTVTDNLTGLIWLRKANLWGQTNWTNAVMSCNALCQGTPDAELSDGSVAGDWRMPNINELLSLIHWGYVNPPVPNTEGTGKCTQTGDPFTGIQGYVYWTSTTKVNDNAKVHTVWMIDGNVSWIYDKFQALNYTWPVRGP